MRKLRKHFVCISKRLEVEVHQAGRIEHIGDGEKIEAVLLIKLRGVSVGINSDEAASCAVAGSIGALYEIKDFRA